jgi:hypothetical protein
MTKFDNVVLGNIRTDINAALAAVAKKYKIDLGIGKISYTAETFTTKLTAVSANGIKHDDDGDKLPGSPALRAAFTTNAVYLGFKASDLGSRVMFQGEEFTLVGARMKAKAKLVVAKDGKMFAAHCSAVKVIS